MACKITWTPLAKQTFNDNCDYLINNWTQREVDHFISKVEYAIELIAENPKANKASQKRKNVRSILIVKQIRLYYKYDPKINVIMLLVFFDTRQKPTKLKLR